MKAIMPFWLQPNSFFRVVQLSKFVLHTMNFCKLFDCSLLGKTKDDDA